MEEKGWKVYAQINPAGEVTRIYSDAFEEPGEGAVLIGEGNGDKYAHAQSRYLAKDIRDESGRANYRWTGEALEEIPEAEKPAAPAPGRSELEILRETVDMLVISALGG